MCRLPSKVPLFLPKTSLSDVRSSVLLEVQSGKVWVHRVSETLGFWTNPY